MKRNLGSEVADAVRNSAEVTAKRAQRNVAMNNTTWHGDLYRSISARRIASPYEASYEIVADVPYAAYVEFGTGVRGGGTKFKHPTKFTFDSPPLTPDLVSEITEWVMTKPVFYGPRTTGVSWAIAKKIAKEGTYASPYMRPAWFKGKPEMIRNAGYAARRVVRRG
jgi:hypothetical protein